MAAEFANLADGGENSRDGCCTARRGAPFLMEAAE